MRKFEIYKPGDLVPASGVYRAEHAAHRLMHEATLLEDDLFPRCRRCNNAVRFHLVRPISGKRLLPFRSSVILEEFEPRVPRLKLVS